MLSSWDLQFLSQLEVTIPYDTSLNGKLQYLTIPLLTSSYNTLQYLTQLEVTIPYNTSLNWKLKQNLSQLSSTEPKFSFVIGSRRNAELILIFTRQLSY